MSKNGNLDGLFFCHEDAATLFNQFPTVVVMDATYRINRYNLPLVQIAGVDSSNKTFFIESAFVIKERVENYAWLLSQSKRFVFVSKSPKVDTTDRDLALMTAIEQELPNASHLLCRWHIAKDASANSLVCYHGLMEESSKGIFSNWYMVADKSDTEEQFEDNYAEFLKLSPETNGRSEFTQYKNDAWFLNKER